MEKATKPKSCGGTEDFKRLALEGDNILNRALMELFSEVKDTGKQTKLRTEFHARRTLVLLGKFLGLDQAISAHDPTHRATSNEIKEVVESLLGASHQVNGFAVVKKIVAQLLTIAKDNNFMDRNWKGELNEFLQKEKAHAPKFCNKNLSSSDHQPLWQCTIRVHYQGKDYQFQSATYSTKKDAEQDAAFRFLKAIGYVHKAQSVGVALKQNTAVQQQLQAQVPQSIVCEEIRFIKTSDFFNYGKINVSVPQTCNSLIKWVVEKQETGKDYFLLAQLCVLFRELQTTSWIAKIDQKTLILINLKIEDKSYFALGTASSKTKAQQQAAKKIIEDANLLSWIKQHCSKNSINNNHTVSINSNGSINNIGKID